MKKRLFVLAVCMALGTTLLACEGTGNGSVENTETVITQEQWELVFIGEQFDNYTVTYGFDASWVMRDGEKVYQYGLGEYGGIKGIQLKITQSQASIKMPDDLGGTEKFEGENAMIFKNGMAEMFRSFQDKYADAIYNPEEDVYEIPLNTTVFGPSGAATPITMKNIQIKLGEDYVLQSFVCDMEQELFGQILYYDNIVFEITDIGTTVIE